MRKLILLVFIALAAGCTPEWSEVEYEVDTSRDRFTVVYINSLGNMDTIRKFTNNFSRKYWLEKGSDIFIKVVPEQDTTEVGISVSWDNELLENIQMVVDSAGVVEISTKAE